MNPELADLLEVAQALGPLRKDIVFTGGSMLSLLLPDGSPSVRHTEDVDCIVEVATYVEYTGSLSHPLRQAGLRECLEPGSPMCRWELGSKPILVDVMPTAPEALNLNNQWFLQALRHSQDYPLAYGVTIRGVSPVYFLATKLEAILTEVQAIHP